MKNNLVKILLTILLISGGVNAAFADYRSAGSYNGDFQFTKTVLSLENPWIGWRFANYDHNGIDDALRYSRWYVGGSKAGWETYRTKPQDFFYTPFWQGKEILYMDYTYGVTQRQNEGYGVGDVQDGKTISDITTHEIAFYPGELMGPEEMSYFYVRWTGFWDYDDNGGGGYWIGQETSTLGDPTDGSVWQGPGVRHRGNGVARYTQVTYDIPETENAVFTRKPGQKIEVTINGNDHQNWTEYYGFGNSDDVDEHGYYINSYGVSDKLSGGKGTFTLDGTFDETESVTIYYHQLYRRSQTISGQTASHPDAKSEARTVNQHFQASRISTVIKGYMYPSDLAVTQDKWNNSVKLTWTPQQNDKNIYNTEGGWLVFRQKEGETGYDLLTASRLNKDKTSYTDNDIESGAEYTYWVTFAPKSYEDITAPIESKLSCSCSLEHDNTFTFSDVNAELYNGTNGGILLTWTPEKENDVTFIVQRWNEERKEWQNLNGNGQDATNYVDKDVEAYKEYKYRIKTSYWGQEFYSEEKSTCYAIMTTIMEFTASQGIYSNMVKLNWNVNVLSKGDTRYVVSRKLLGDDQGVFTRIYDTVGKESSFYYEDISALPGQYYDYKVTAFAYIETPGEEEAKWVEGNSKESDGFVQTRGIVTGRIKYGTGTAVQGAKVILDKSDNNDNDNKQFYSLYFNGEETDGLEWKPSDEVLENYFTVTDSPWTIQMYVRPETGISGTQPFIDVNGYAGVSVTPVEQGYELYVKSATGNSNAASEATGIVIPADSYTHVVFSYDGADTYTVRTIVQDTDNVEFVEGKQKKTFTGKENVNFDDKDSPRTISFGTSGFKGYVDEIRIWSKELSDKEIINSHDRILTCTEANLLCYWQMDEGISGLDSAYDYSKTNGIANINHATIKGDVLMSEVVPTAEQLSLYGLTDENGNYVIRGVPFSGDGTAYIVRPIMGIHEFSPSYHTRYVSSNTLTHDDVSFEDVSSFPASGVVYYENTTYPVQGCRIFVDENVCTSEGKVIETDENGRFEISVPIGEHYIRIEKNGHTFVNEGRYPTGIGTRYTFEKPVSNLTFYDNTLVHITGRVVGGDIEGKQIVGHGMSNNNIGVAQLVLTPTNDIYSLNVTKKVNGTVESYENNSKELEAASATDRINSKSWRGSSDNAGNIYINTDAETGEFSALVPPLVYNVSAPTIISTKQTVGAPGLADMSNPLAISGDTLVNDNGTKQIFEYNCKYICTYHSTPTFTVRQSDLENGSFGIESHTVTDETGSFTVDIIGEDGSYKYGVPFFVQGDPYTFKLKGFEQYTNYDSGEAVTTTVPLKNCVVTISNALSDGQPIIIELEEGADEDMHVGDVINLQSNQLTLDKNGEATYRWKAGLANITAPYSRTLSITYTVGGEVNSWKIDGKEFMEGIILGTLPTGNNFVTMGPDKVLMVLRDPPGSGSSAEWTSGTMTAYEKKVGHNWNTENVIKNTNHFGGTVKLVAGLGVGYIQETSMGDDLTWGGKVVSTGENATTRSHSVTINESISTSPERDLVGTLGDVFIGQATNLVFGKAREVGFRRDASNNISLGVQDVISVGDRFSTFFTYSVFYIESFLLPNLKTLRDNLLITLSPEDYANYQNKSDGLKFVTTLSPDDPRFGSNNHDKDVWGEDAVTFGKLEGPSYKVVLPERLKEEKSYRIGETIQTEQDSIYQYNLQISNWVRHLAANEEEKVRAWENREERLLKNYSFEGGTDINYSYETDTTFVDSSEHNSGALAILGNVVSFEMNGVGWEVETSTETGGTRHRYAADTETQTAKFSFNLSEDIFDALSVDVYKSSSSYIFRTRAGQTSGPYEGEEYTKYYQPGKHKLHEGTMQLEVPDIEVEVATVTNIPSGSAASYTLLLSNKSEMDLDMMYDLVQIEESNPHGAQLSIDGTPLSTGRAVKVLAGQTMKKTLLLKQSNLGILDYENIGIAFVSSTQGDPTGVYPIISDTVYISAHFVPSSSPVKMELNRTLLNTTSGANLDITFNSFDRNYYNLKAFRIQYMKQGDTDWTLLKEYLVNAKKDQQLSSTQALLPETANVTYTLDMSSFADGRYTFRVLSASTYGTGESILVTDAVEVVKDMARPMVFGTPKPATGILGVGDDIEITFNENINGGRLTSTGNFLVTAALNGDAVAHDIAMKATGTDEPVARTEANINLAGKSFAIDMWVRISGEGTIFSHGNGTNKLELGVKRIDGQYHFTVNGNVYGNPMPADKWIYLAFNLDQEYFDGPCFTALYADDAASEYLAVEKPIEKHEGNGVVALGNGFTGAIHEVALWDEAIDVRNLQAQMHETKKPTTEHLIGYWRFNEGNGTQAKDLARNRHMSIGSTSWYMNNQNKSLDLVDALYDKNDALVINLSQCAATTNDDYMIEMWFLAGTAQDGDVVYLFDSDAFGVALERGKMKLYADNKAIMSMGTKSYTDSKWHHLAINVLRNGNTIAYIDGEVAGQVTSANVPALQGALLHLGTQCYRTGSTEQDIMQNKLRGKIDEIRIWNATVNASVIRDRMNQRLKGNEAGLVAYYPFEEERLDDNSQVVTAGTPLDMVTGKHEVTARKTEGHTATFTDEAPALKPTGNATNINYNFVASDRGIVLELNEDADRLEGVTVNITVKDVLDLNGNKSLPITWTALVKKNQLMWFDDNIDVVGRIGEEKKFTAIVTNQSAQPEHWILSDLPTWLSANFTSGSLPSLGNQEITFTIDASAPSGKSEFTLYISGNNAIPVPLTVNMNLKADAPDWSVEPADFESSATLFGAVMINVDGKVAYSEDEDDLVAAFIGGMCVGVTNVQYEAFSDSYRIYLNIHGNAKDIDKEVELKVWDASTGIVHPVVKVFEGSDVNDGNAHTLTYQENVNWGDYDQAYTVYATDYIQQSTPLKKNWNWISVYVYNNESRNAINSVLESINPNGAIIKNISANSEYMTGRGIWYSEELVEGNIPYISTRSMYKLRMNAADTLVVNGEQENGTRIEIQKGWNWVPYTRSFSMSLDDAFAATAPARNDQVKGQEGYAMYNGTEWNGTLKTLEPGKGYLYKRSPEEGTSISYPTKRNAPTASPAKARRAVETSIFTPIDPCEYESNMTVLAVVKENEEVLDNVEEIAVFNGAVCIAAARAEDDGFFYLTIPGDKTVTDRLTVIAAIDGNIVELSTSLYFGEDVTLGDIDTPFALTVGNTTDIEKMLAHGKYNRMQVVDLNGRIFYAGNVADFDENDLNDGQYIFEFFTTDGQAVCYKRLIRRFAE